MKNCWRLKSVLVFSLLASIVPGCGTDSSRTERDLSLNLINKNNIVPLSSGAPAWILKGTTYQINNEKRQFYGVGTAMVMGDMAMQKATADDEARVETGRLFSLFMNAVFKDYLGGGATEPLSLNKELLSSQLESASNSMMARTRIAGNWRDIKTNTVWVYATLDLNMVKNQMADFGEIDERFKRYFVLSADNVFDRLFVQSAPRAE